jgi:hypothetical protein
MTDSYPSQLTQTLSSGPLCIRGLAFGPGNGSGKSKASTAFSSVCFSIVISITKKRSCTVTAPVTRTSGRISHERSGSPPFSEDDTSDSNSSRVCCKALCSPSASAVVVSVARDQTSIAHSHVPVDPGVSIAEHRPSSPPVLADP